MLRKSLFALLIASSFLGCKKKGGDASSPAGEPAASAGKDMAPPHNEAEAGDFGGEKGGGPTGAKPADPARAGIGAGSSSAPMVVDGKMKRADDMVTATPAPAPQGVRAGEWDDNANYRDYVKWLKESPRNVARLDVSDRQFIVVKDKNGKPVPNCKISITSNNTETSLITMASGRALWFPHAYGAGDQATATAL